MKPGAQPRDVRVFVGLGSNLGDRDKMIQQALDWLASHPRLELVRASGVLRTEPWGVVDQPEFLNAVAELRTELEPFELLATLKRAEAELGRTPSERWGPRAIDLDILLYGEHTVCTPVLQIPHPRLTERWFVVAQLLELDPALCLPPDRTPLCRFLQ